MDLRSKLSNALETAGADGDTLHLATLRLIQAAIRDRDLALRSGGGDTRVDDDEIVDILRQMLEQRLDMARSYEEAGRLEQAQTKRTEADLIVSLLPREPTEDEIAAEIRHAIAALDARSLRDLGRVMADLRRRLGRVADQERLKTLVLQHLT